MKYGQFTTFQTVDGKAEELRNILLQASKEMCVTKSCQQYTIGSDKEATNTLHVFEVWETKEDHDSSLNSEEAKELISKAMPLLAGRPQSVAMEISE